MVESAFVVLETSCVVVLIGSLFCAKIEAPCVLEEVTGADDVLVIELPKFANENL